MLWLSDQDVKWTFKTPYFIITCWTMMGLWFLHLFIVFLLKKSSYRYMRIREARFLKDYEVNVNKTQKKAEQDKRPMTKQELQEAIKHAQITQDTVLKSKDKSIAQVVLNAMEAYRKEKPGKRIMYSMLQKYIDQQYQRRAESKKTMVKQQTTEAASKTARPNEKTQSQKLFDAYVDAIKRIKAENLREVRGRVSTNYVRGIAHMFILFRYFSAFNCILFARFSPLTEDDLHQAREIFSVAIALVTFDIFHKEKLNWTFSLDRASYILLLGIVVSYTDEPLHALVMVYFRAMTFPVDFFIALKGYIPDYEETRITLAISAHIYFISLVLCYAMHLVVFIFKFQYYTVCRVIFPIFLIPIVYHDYNLVDYLIYQLKKAKIWSGEVKSRNAEARKIFGPLYDQADNFEPDPEESYTLVAAPISPSKVRIK